MSTRCLYLKLIGAFWNLETKPKYESLGNCICWLFSTNWKSHQIACIAINWIHCRTIGEGSKDGRHCLLSAEDPKRYTENCRLLLCIFTGAIWAMLIVDLSGMQSLVAVTTWGFHTSQYFFQVAGTFRAANIDCLYCFIKFCQTLRARVSCTIYLQHI